MNLPTEIFDEVVVVHTPEEIGEVQSQELAAYLTTLGRDDLVVDLDGTETISSSGLEMLLEVQESLQANGGDVKIATTNHVNRKILEATRLDQQLEVFDSVLDAVTAFS